MEISDDPLWYKKAIIYQVHVKGFKDLNSDGTGDFQGLTSKLDYLESLGITAIWLLPFYPSPLKDDGYDISDYFNIHPKYGTIKDFRDFLKKAHSRGLRVITELVINHTSDQHPWFQRARQAPANSQWRNYYVWSDTPDKYRDARIIFKDFEISNWTWDPVANAYYWHRFYYHQPSLNFDNPRVHREIIKIVDFWLNMGVDGLRLDAVPYLYQREGTNCENLPETHAFLKFLRKHVEDNFKNRMLLAEANQWPEDAIAYFGDGDECQMAFHFPLMPRLYMSLQMEDRFPIVDILEQTPPIPETCQWAMFLRNHDELTLEMVSDEERDFMYHMYAKDHSARINLGIRRRLAPLLENDRRKIQLLNILLLSLPGTPVLYYGDEIGMGDNYYLGDRNGVRTPMQWGGDRNAGFSAANPQQLYLPLIIDPEYHYEVVNVENEDRNTASLLWWTRRLLFERQKYPAFGLGSLEFTLPDNPRVLAYTRTYENNVILVVANLSRFPQAAQLDLSKYIGYTPVELAHHNKFPPVKDNLYHITLGPYGYFLLSLKEGESLTANRQLTTIKISGSWEAVFKNQARYILETEALPRFLLSQPWFEGQGSTLQKVRIVEIFPIAKAFLLILEVTFVEEQWTDNYLLPLTFKELSSAESHNTEMQKGVLANLQINGTKGCLLEATYDPSFCQTLLTFIATQRRQTLGGGELQGKRDRSLYIGKTIPTSRVVSGSHNHAIIYYDQTLLLKLYRRLDEGLNPDVDMTEYLSEKAHYLHVPQYRGQLLWKKVDGTDGTPIALALLQTYLPNHGNGWDYTWDTLTRYYEHILSHREELERELRATDNEEAFMEKLIGSYCAIASQIGQRAAEMHSALASDLKDPSFKPEPFGQLYQRSTYQGVRVAIRRVLMKLKNLAPSLPENLQITVKEILTQESFVLGVLKHVLSTPQTGNRRIRIHGNFQLQETLFTGNDILIVNFEGAKGVSLNMRRSKHSPLQDVASMLYSFQAISYTHLFSEQMMKPEMASALISWSDLWYRQIARSFLVSYETTVEQLCPFSLLPPPEQRAPLLLTWMIKQAFYAIDDALKNQQKPLGNTLTILHEILKKHESMKLPGNSAPQHFAS